MIKPVRKLGKPQKAGARATPAELAKAARANWKQTELERELDKAQVYAPPASGYNTGGVGGARSIFPYEGAMGEAARNMAALICPPINAPHPHETAVLRWPCESCRLWAQQGIKALVDTHRAQFPRFGVESDAESSSDKTSEKAGQKAVRKPSQSGRRGRTHPKQPARRKR